VFSEPKAEANVPRARPNAEPPTTESTASLNAGFHSVASGFAGSRICGAGAMVGLFESSLWLSHLIRSCSSESQYAIRFMLSCTA